MWGEFFPQKGILYEWTRCLLCRKWLYKNGSAICNSKCIRLINC